MEVKKQTRENWDFISDLPDPILIDILSLLTTREAVHALVLSKRWLNLWIYLPRLHFDSKEFDSDLSFKRFVSAVMFFRRISYLDTFCLKWTLQEVCSDDCKIVKAWLLHVLACNPRIIDLDCPSFGLVDLPSSVFTCSSLVELNFSMHGYRNTMPCHISLPNLKKLYLKTEVIQDEHMEKLLSGSPSLEELELNDLELYGSVFVISSTVLKHLSLVDCISSAYKIEITTPCLLSLQLNGNFIGEIALNNMSSLVKASLYFNSYDDSYLSDSDDEFYGNFYDIWGDLSSVSELEVLGLQLMRILRTMTECLTFGNLKQLTLDGCFKDDDDYNDLGQILTRNSPNIERIIVLQ